MPKLTRQAFFTFWLPAILMLGVVAVESTDRFSADHTGPMLATFLGWFSIHLQPTVLSHANFVLRKCGHVTGYAFLSFLLFRACRGTYRALAGYYDWRTSRLEGLPPEQAFRFLWQGLWLWIALLGTVATAIADEMHQKRIPSRGGSWWDVLLDTSAAIAAQLLILAFASHKTMRAQQKREGPPVHAAG